MLEIHLFVLVHNIINQPTKIVLADLWVYEGVVKIADKRLLAVLVEFYGGCKVCAVFGVFQVALPNFDGLFYRVAAAYLAVVKMYCCHFRFVFSCPDGGSGRCLVVCMLVLVEAGFVVPVPNS